MTRPILLVAFLLGLAAAAAGIEPAPFWRMPVTSHGPVLERHDPPADSIDGVSCGACHQQTHADWAASLHARAVSPGLSGQLGAFSRDEQLDCLKCHAPRAEQQSAWLSAPASARIDGVDCASCHVREGRHFGLRRVGDTPHGEVVSSAIFARSEFCAACHQFGPDGLALNGKPLENTFEEWSRSRYAAAGTTCQSCHMPEKRHAFRGIHDPDMTRRGLLVRARRLAWGVEVSATNAGAGHHLPTYATPLIRIEISSESARGEHIIGRALVWHTDKGLSEVSDTRLAVDETVAISLDLPTSVASEVLVRVDPGHDYHARIYPDLIAALGDALEPEAIATLRAAAATARAQSYDLYRFRCPVWGGQVVECASETWEAIE